VSLRPVEVLARLPPPSSLSGDEREEFLAIINSAEGGWFSRGSLPLLVQLCRHICSARKLAALIDACDPAADWGYYRELLVQQRGESAILAALSVKTRLAPTTARATEGSPPRIHPAPWEHKADDPA
jgi:hypothetical protein